MKERRFLDIINHTLEDNSFLGDDCAIIDNNFTITQDTLVEDVHFSLKNISPYLLGKKSVAVNLSDIAASLSKPLYITIAFSAPNSCDETFVREFYQGINDICKKYDIRVIGGDITGSSKLVISICAIGKKLTKYNVSRKNAQVGDIIFTTNAHGLSACGLFLLECGNKNEKMFIDAHLAPEPDIKNAANLAEFACRNLAVTDSSDGLGDALYNMSNDSNLTFEIDFSLLKTPKDLFKIAKLYDKNPEEWILWGGEDYHLLCAASPEVFEKLNNNLFFKIGTAVSKQEYPVIIKNAYKTKFIDYNIINKHSYNHFEPRCKENS